MQKEPAENIGAVSFRIAGSNDAQADGVYTVFENMPITQHIACGEARCGVRIRRRQTQLPFSIYLVDFLRENHPGTQEARWYSSEILVRDGDVEFRKIIKMNEPLRHGGFTFYQSSFISDSTGDETTILAVVRNRGYAFPYIASLIICFGLLLHMLARVPRLIPSRVA